MKQPKSPYFDIQAEFGITKHGGGLKATKELIGLCRINKDSNVLVVGCGNGASACYLAKKIKCQMTGIDISKKMIERAKQRAKKLEIKFQAADAQKLPFKESLFDVVLSESVTAFLNKKKAINEYKRVTKKGGYIGLNETTWLKKPSREIVEFVHQSMGVVEPENYNNWKKLLEKAGLEVIASKEYRVKILSQAVNEIRLMTVTEIFTAWGRLIAMYFKSPYYRKVIHKMAKQAKNMPKNMFKFMGYGIYVGRK